MLIFKLLNHNQISVENESLSRIQMAKKHTVFYLSVRICEEQLCALNSNGSLLLHIEIGNNFL